VALFLRLQRAVESSAAVQAVMIRAQVGGEQPLMLENIDYESEVIQPTAYVRTHMGDSTMIGLELRAGRRFDERDAPGSLSTALVSETLALQLWGGQSPLGRRVRIGSVEAQPSDTPQPWRIVVGVVSDILEGTPFSRDRSSSTLYLPMTQLAPTAAGVAFRHRGDSRAAMVEFEDILAEVGPTVELTRITDFDEMFDRMRGMSMAASKVLIGCFGFALILAIGGIYGLTSRAVTQRNQEIGIRRALGATNVRIIALFLRSSVRQLAIGLGVAILIGSVASVAVLKNAELEAGPFVAGGILVPTLITVLVLTATYLPTRRAIRMNPRAAIWRE
jgi:putative ABC transport system permease protein